MSPVLKNGLWASALRPLCLTAWLVCCLAVPVLPQSAANEEELAASLAEARTDEERSALLAAEKELVTTELRQALVRQGQRLSGQGSYERALALYLLALHVAEQLGDKAGAADAAQYVCGIHTFQGDYAQAFDHCRRSLKFAEEIGDTPLTAKALGSIALIHTLQSDNEQALDYYRKSLELAAGIKDRAMVARLLNNIGGVYQSQGDYAQALDYYRKSLELAEELEEKGGMAALLANIGVLYSYQGNYAQALEYYRKSLKIAEEVGDEMLISNALDNMGIAHFLDGDYAQALAYYGQSLKIAESVDDKRGVAITLGDMGEVYQAQGDNARALAHYQKSLKLAEEVGDKEWAVEMLNKIGSLYESQGNHAKVLELAGRSASMAVQIGYLEGLWEARTAAGKAHRALNQPELSRQAFTDAINTIEKLRGHVAGNERDRQRFFENKLVPYSQMVALLIARNESTAALTYAERAKGRVLLDVLRTGRVRINKAMTAAEQARERKLNSALVALNTQLSQQKLEPDHDEKQIADLTARLETVRLEYESFQTSLYAAHPELKVQRGETLPLTFDEASRMLPADGKTALLEYVVADDNCFLFVLTKAAPTGRGGAASLRIYTVNIKRRELTALVESFQKHLGERNLAFGSLAERLYKMLLKPAEAELRGTDTLCIVPDGVLWQLPFQALKPTPRRYLIEDRAIFYAPSLSTLREMLKPGKRVGESVAVATPILAASRTDTRQLLRVNSQSAPTLLAVGNPLLNTRTVARQRAVFADEELGALPEAEKEVKALRELYGGLHSRVYTGASAREESVKAEIGNYRIVHFATHGILDNRDPLYSHLMLSQETGASGEDGLLEAREIMEMDLRAELVVLSACQTAGGRVGAGEGVIGMTWALFVAGSPTTLVSQWKVDTRSTSKLMVEFHGNLQRQRQQGSVVRKAEALRQAMLTLLRSEEYELPYYWAPFVLIGDGF